MSFGINSRYINGMPIEGCIPIFPAHLITHYFIKIPPIDTKWNILINQRVESPTGKMGMRPARILKNICVGTYSAGQLKRYPFGVIRF